MNNAFAAKFFLVFPQPTIYGFDFFSMFQIESIMMSIIRMFVKSAFFLCKLYFKENFRSQIY